MNFTLKMNTENMSTVRPLVGDETMIPVGFIITLENLFSFLVLYRCTRVNYQIRVLSINLCVSDLLAGISLCFPIEAYYFGENCGFKKYFYTFFVTISLLTVTMMDMDRCLALHFGIRYYNYISPRLLIFICTSFWIVSFLNAYMMYFDPASQFGIHCEPAYHAPKNIITISASAFLLVSILSNLVMFTYLVHTIRKGFRQIKDINFPAQTTGRCTEQAIVIKKLLVITGCFLFCATPYIITTFPVLDYNTPFGKKVHIVTAVIIVANSAINPFLYVWRFREARYQIKRLLCFWNRSYTEVIQIKHNKEIATYLISRSVSLRMPNS